MARLTPLLLAVCLVVFPSAAFAAPRIAVPRGPIELHEAGARYEASFEVRNTGDDALYVSRVAPRTDSDDVRLPRGMTARFTSGQTSAVIPPSGSATVRVTWGPGVTAPGRSFYGHVVVTSTDEIAGEVAVGIVVHAGRWSGLTRHLLGALVLLPLLGAALIGVTGGSRRPRVIALGVTLGCAALALLAWTTFDPNLVRADGGEGLQHVERAIALRALGAEVFLGVDGASLPMLVVCALTSLSGVLASWDERKRPAVFFALYLLLSGGCLGAMASLDGVLYIGCLGVALTAAYLLVGLHGGERSSTAASRMLMMGGTGLALLAIVLGMLHTQTIHTFLVDGTPVSHTWAFTELGRIQLGETAARRMLVLSLLGVGLLAGIFPLHVWLAPVLRSAPPAVSALVCAGLLRAAMLALVRIDVTVLSDSLRWARTAVLAVGAAGAVYGALVATAESDLCVVLSFGLVSLSGAALAGVASTTPQAMLGALTAMTASGLCAAAAMLVTGALRQRTGTLESTVLRGLGVEAPVLATAIAVSALAVGAMPGTVSFWSTWLVGLGTIPVDWRICAVVLLASVALAASQCRPMLRVLRGKLPESLRRSEVLVPFGGHVPDLRPHELVALLPLLLLVLFLGVFPSALVSRAQATARDLTDLATPAALE